MKLFDRLGHRLAQTDAGQHLLSYADQLLMLAQDTQASVAQRSGVKGSLTVSSWETLCIYRLPTLLQQFQTYFPRVPLVYRPVPYTELRRSVREADDTRDTHSALGRSQRTR